MNQEQFGYFWEQLKAPLKQQWEKFTDEDLLQIAGNLETFMRTIEVRYRERKEEVSTWANRRHTYWSGLYTGYVAHKPVV